MKKRIAAAGLSLALAVSLLGGCGSAPPGETGVSGTAEAIEETYEAGGTENPAGMGSVRKTVTMK